jgi:hypothetical protein
MRACPASAPTPILARSCWNFLRRALIPLLRNQGSLHRKRLEMPVLLQSPEQDCRYCSGNEGSWTGRSLEARDVNSIDARREALKMPSAALSEIASSPQEVCNREVIIWQGCHAE